MNQCFENAYLNVINAPSSIFSKEDVLKLINDLRANVNADVEQYNSEATELQFQEFSSNVKSRLYQYLNTNDLIDYDSVEFEIEYNNQLVLRSVNLDLDSWTDEFDDIMLDEYQSAFNNPVK